MPERITSNVAGVLNTIAQSHDISCFKLQMKITGTINKELPSTIYHNIGLFLMNSRLYFVTAINDAGKNKPFKKPLTSPIQVFTLQFQSLGL